MEPIVIKLLEKNQYTRTSQLTDGVVAYKSDNFGDIIIVAPYTIQDLAEFEAESNIATSRVMDVFDQVCEINPNALKDTSLVICLKCETSEDLNEANNAILAVEEDYFGFRKYVIPYTAETVPKLSEIDDEDFMNEIYRKLKDGFENFGTSNLSRLQITEYSIVMNLFVKLPFMRLLQGEKVETSRSLDEHMDSSLQKHVRIRTLVSELTNEKEDTKEDDEEIDLDEEIAAFLNQPNVKLFLNEEAAL